MSRSIKKGPFIDFKLEKRVVEMNEGQKKSVVKTWSRRSVISPDFVGHTIVPRTWLDTSWESFHLHVPSGAILVINK